jgi:hypothetical protein
VVGVTDRYVSTTSFGGGAEMLRRVVVSGATIFLVVATLAVAAPPASAAWTLYNQLDSPVGARISTDSINDFNDSQGADDFVVPEGKVWSIGSVYAPGAIGGPANTVPAVNVFFYEDAGTLPGALIASYDGVPSTTGPDNLTVQLDPAMILEAGTYWLSVQADMSSLPDGNSWLWALRGAQTNDPGAWYGLGSTTFAPLQDFRFLLAGTSERAKPPAAVNISERPARIGRDGSVPVKVWARCEPGLQAFELDVSVGQGSAFGSTTIIGPPDVIVCDGLWHPILVRVLPERGSFRSGRATVDAFLGIFDPSEGDLEATDSATIRLFRARPHHHVS